MKDILRNEAEKTMQTNSSCSNFDQNNLDQDALRSLAQGDSLMHLKIVHVQSVLPEEDIIALKEKTGESTIKDAIAQAVYHYLECKVTRQPQAKKEEGVESKRVGKQRKKLHSPNSSK